MSEMKNQNVNDEGRYGRGTDAVINLNGADRVADVPPRLFGSFVEHLGRCVYGGIYEPGHPNADEDGFRTDVLDLVRELGVTCVRYPGGNFVSGYKWEDGTGPRDKRPVRRDLAWHCTETNEIGIDDFYRWSVKAGTEIMLAVNMGTRGLESALEELEYVNGAPGTEIADRRVANGIPEPMGVRMWCIGNEMDGHWQIGHMDPDEYAAAADRVAHAMKLAESSLELVACGSSHAHMPTFGEWERKVLTKSYRVVDFVSCHAYYYDHGHVARDAAQLQDFLASAEDMTYFIDTVVKQADTAREANHGTRDIALSFDEWGVWYSDIKDGAGEGGAWPIAPHKLENIYSAADAVVEGSLMITLLKHCDRVRSASRAQLVNAIAPIMTEPDGPAWKQTTFYPFAEAANHAKGVVYAPSIDSPTVATATYGEVAAVDAVVTWDEETRHGLLLAVNRDLGAAHGVTVSLAGLGDDESGSGVTGTPTVVRAQLLHDDDPYRHNTADEPDTVVPQTLRVAASGAGGSLSFALPAVSWAAVEFTL
ncbi:alpha-L-arabinofuranosidase [Bifidobacterium sp. UTCIF-37]|uniref:alpha-N-arabinofuranosidase n=1 Tax=unclassified Bifidobacterium TaxID=2608897 RepID=UPI0015E273F3|nr:MULTISPECIES: alpha-L-arabinofuranosidase C-terminal domain-containing protein [unclassified Bifidobacterium]TPF85552.1 alpha-L-arabinofuranosidase [Bifidobacterium sp. UTCIF-37]TPF87634.1 alpha-L-arabinofuranosidase [Bifidobacterium sp. UTCIF-38]